MKRIRIAWPKGEVTAELDDTATTRELVAALPARSRANTWGEEVYFTIPVTVKKEKSARDVVPPGTVCFWVEGSSLALPYGQTPISKGNECRLVTTVNVLGKLEGDPRVLAGIQDGDSVEVSIA
jgi:uncharacterized protein